MTLRKIFKRFLIITLPLITALLFFFFYHTDVTANEDAYVYDLPFKKTPCRVVQGYGGLFSHIHTAALDFEMPVGTPVYAAREGTIYSFADTSDEGGISSAYKQKANYIIIKHSDGSFGCYWHLKKDGVAVKSGAVAKGQLIGYSGATGQVLRPHLHFSVKRVLNYEPDSFLKTKFKTSEGNVFLKTGRSYKN